jgi:DNA-binding XRE family transcriptional regulator
MEKENGVNRKDLIKMVSSELIKIRKECKLTQDELAEILGISKNTIVNVEKNNKELSWAVVMSLIMLFNQTTSIQSIVGKDNSAMELITKCAFLDKDKRKNNMLYTTALSGIGVLASSVAPIVGGIVASGIYDLLNKNKSK